MFSAKTLASKYVVVWICVIVLISLFVVIIILRSQKQINVKILFHINYGDGMKLDAN